MRALLAFSIGNHIALTGSRVAVSLGALELAASPFAIGLMLSFYGLLPMVLSVPGGRWIDRVGTRIPMLAGTALLVFGAAVPFVAWDIGGLYLASVTIGLGFMTFFLALQKEAGAVGGPGARTANFSLLALGYSASGFLGPTLTGMSIDGAGHRAAFGLLALAPLLVGIAMLRLGAGTRAPGGDGADAARAAPGRVMELLQTPELRRLYVATALLSSAWDVHQFLVPLYGAQIGLSASLIGLVLGAFSLATFAVRAGLPAIARRVAEWPLILAAMGVSAAVYLLYPFFPSLAAMTALSFVLGLGLGVAQPMGMVVLHRVAPPQRIGEAVGLRLTLVNGTQTFLPTAFGALGSALGIAPVFWSAAALIAGGAWYTGRGLRAEGQVDWKASPAQRDAGEALREDEPRT